MNEAMNDEEMMQVCTEVTQSFIGSWEEGL